ncbi:MAG: hypothetical protein AAFR73_05895 [Pseudomonadota bacterium]
MRIYKTVSLAAAGLWLAACSDIPFQQSRNAPSQILLPDGTRIAGADGWCIDEATTRAGGDTSVVVLGSCAALARDSDQPRPDIPGVLTISVEAEAGAIPDGETLRKFFVSDAGRAALARDGEAASVSILDTRVDEEGLLYLHASDASIAPGASNEIWRALFGLGGRFVAVSFYTRLEDQIAIEDGLAALVAQVEELRSANRG